MSVGSDSPASNSQFLASSHSSLNQSKKVSNEISKTYKHASQLYLTRQLAEAYEVLQPVISPAHSSDVTDSGIQSALIASAATSQRIKIWSLYVTLLNAIVDLGPEEGQRDFGIKEYNSIVKLVQTGEIWGQVVRNGYFGNEGGADAEVVYNLSNLLLAQAPDQIVNQTRLETYLASSSGELNFSEHLEQRLGGHASGRKTTMNGASTPKDLSSRIKILELFTLHVLPRNEEWDYARSFINNSDVLDEERREAFLQTLQELQEAKENEQSVFTETEDEFVDEPEVEEPRDPATESWKGTSTSSSLAPLGQNESSHRRTSSEVDYGIDHEHPNGSIHKASSLQRPSPSEPLKPMKKLVPTPVPETSSPLTPKSPSASLRQSQPKSTVPHSSALRRPNHRPSAKPKSKANSSAAQTSSNNSNFMTQARHLVALVSKMSSNLTYSLTKDATSLFRTLMFLVAFLVMLSRRDLRYRLQRILEKGFAKVRSTVGMGVKVSYI